MLSEPDVSLTICIHVTAVIEQPLHAVTLCAIDPALECAGGIQQAESRRVAQRRSEPAVEKSGLAVVKKTLCSHLSHFMVIAIALRVGARDIQVAARDVAEASSDIEDLSAKLKHKC